jgi:hypothetical protein
MHPVVDFQFGVVEVSAIVRYRLEPGQPIGLR